MSSSGSERLVLTEALGAAMREASGKSVLFSEAVADRVGMNPADLESLDLLIRHGPMPAGQLARQTGLTTGAITGLIDRLERKGYARREPHFADRRRVIVQPLTDQAERDLGPVYAAMAAAMDALLAHYSDEQIAVILDFMTRAAQITDEQITALRTEAPLVNANAARITVAQE